MGGKLKEDLTGKIFCFWTVLHYVGSEKWKCRCKCGVVRNVWRASLIRNQSKSCGCFKSPDDYSYIERTKKRLMNSMEINNKNCWCWTKDKNNRGYGQTTFRKKTGQRSHRISWLVWKGEIPEGLLVLHKCDNPSCINPDHLFLGTHEDNMIDMKVKGRACKGEDSHLHKKNRKKL